MITKKYLNELTYKIVDAAVEVHKAHSVGKHIVCFRKNHPYSLRKVLAGLTSAAFSD